jgi:hypothetical protein
MGKPLGGRVTVLFNNKTSQTKSDSGVGRGATVVRSLRGTLTPTYFSTGQTARMRELCGEPGPTYPDLLEALYYVQFYGIWVSCPSKNARYGGAYLTATGTKSLPGGMSSLPAAVSGGAETVTQITLIEKLGTGDGTTTSFGKTLSGLSGYIKNSVRILLVGTSLIGQTVTEATGTETIATTSQGSGSLIESSGVLSFTFTTAPTAGQVIEASYTFDLTQVNALALFMSRGPQADYIALENSYSTSTKLFTSAIYGYDSSGTAVLKETVDWSPIQGTEDGNGKAVYGPLLFNDGDDDYVRVYPVADATVTSFTKDSTYVPFAGGSRGDAVVASDVVSGFEKYASQRLYPADVIFDVTALTGVGTEFQTLRNGGVPGIGQATSKYLLPMSYETYSEAETDITSFPADRGIMVYWNWGLVNNQFNSNGNAWTPLMGEVAKKHADNFTYAFGGKAVSWYDENNVGGRLSSGRVLEMAYDIDSDVESDLIALGINPIIMDPSAGVMIRSERTTYTPLCDYAYGSYSGSLDYIVKHVINDVLPPQIDKFNDDSHRETVSDAIGGIIKPMTIRPRNVIYAYQVKCDGDNNDETVLANDQFVIQVAIQVTRMSRWIIITFINSNAGTDITLAFK